MRKDRAGAQRLRHIRYKSFARPIGSQDSERGKQEIYWLVENGAKMTGMPAFGPTHDEEAMWNITAFVKAMPDMTEARYAAYPSEHGGGVTESKSKLQVHHRSRAEVLKTHIGGR